MALLPVAEAQALVLAGVEPTPSETAPLADAHGRTLAADLVAAFDQPPFDASAMDGYAVREADAIAGARLRLIGESAAGRPFAGTVGAGEAARIFTGAPVPAGADAVLLQENAEARPGFVLVNEANSSGRHIRRRGLDFTAGTVGIEAGRRLGYRLLSLAAAMGHGQVPVRRRPKVAIIATGDELVPAGTTPGPGQIVASSGPGLAALVAETGGEPLYLGIVPDRREAIAAALPSAQAADADVIVTLGGASVGDHDLVHAALADAGFTRTFWKVALRPGKPLIFGRLGGARVLGMPGNPVSTLVCGVLFLQPLVRALLGRLRVLPLEADAVLAAPVPQVADRSDYLRARLAAVPGALPAVTALPVQDSSMLATLAASDCLLVRPPLAPAAPAGAPVTIIPLGGPED